MKRRWLITLLLCVAVLGGALAFRLWPRTLSPDQCGTVYRHYAAVEGVEATYIKDKHIGGDEQVDVTLLKATDSTSWATLLRDLDMPDFDVEADDDFFVLGGSDLLTVLGYTSYQRVPFAPGLCDLVVLWPAESTVCIFHIATEAQYDRLLKNQFDNLEQ